MKEENFLNYANTGLQGGQGSEWRLGSYQPPGDPGLITLSKNNAVSTNSWYNTVLSHSQKKKKKRPKAR